MAAEYERIEQMIREAVALAYDYGETEITIIGITKRIAAEETDRRRQAVAALTFKRDA